MKLRDVKDISYNKSSLFHGAIMELLPYEYGKQLHTSQLIPSTWKRKMIFGLWWWLL